MQRYTFAISALASLVLAGCGDDHDHCVIGTTDGCNDGLVCEEVPGAEPACFTPLHVRGIVFDLTDGSPIEGARLVALDANGGARSTVVFTAVDGTYSLPVSIPRNADGTLVPESITLRVSAQGYETFPTAPRTALPIDLAGAVMMTGALVVDNATTDVGLLPLAGGAVGLGSISGHVEGDDTGGMLVVGELGATAVSTSVTDTDGEFTLYNVPAGDVVVSAFRVGVHAGPETVTIASDEEVNGVVLSASTDGLSIVEGRVELVNAPGGSMTTVILVVESTFEETFKRGEAPAGLRATMVSGAFSIADVPPGRYVVLAAFENDLLVRDPDEAIGGTDILHIDVPPGQTFSIEDGFKVTGSLAVMSPGAAGLEVIADPMPTFTWADDSSEDGYEVRVYNAYGELLHEDTGVARVTGSPSVSYDWTPAEPLETGMIYQFRAVSWRSSGGGRTYIAATEDLLGVFQFGTTPP